MLDDLAVEPAAARPNMCSDVAHVDAPSGVVVDELHGPAEERAIVTGHAALANRGCCHLVQREPACDHRRTSA